MAQISHHIYETSRYFCLSPWRSRRESALRIAFAFVGRPHTRFVTGPFTRPLLGETVQGLFPFQSSWSQDFQSSEGSKKGFCYPSFLSPLIPAGAVSLAGVQTGLVFDRPALCMDSVFTLPYMH